MGRSFHMVLLLASGTFLIFLSHGLATKDGGDSSTGANTLMEQLRRRELLMQQMHMAQQRQRMQQLQQWQAHLQQPRYTPPPHLPEPRARKPAVRPGTINQLVPCLGRILWLMGRKKRKVHTCIRLALYQSK